MGMSKDPKFLEKGLNMIKNIRGYIVPLSPEVILLNLWQNSKIHKMRKYIIAIMLVAAKSLIAQNWKTDTIPLINLLLQKIWNYLAMEKISTKF